MDSLLEQSQALPRGMWLSDLLNPYIAIKDVPRLPPDVPRALVLHGRPVWHLPKPEPQQPGQDGLLHDGEYDHVHGRRVTFRLRADYPVHCHIASDDEPQHFSEIAGSLCLLTLGYSYILCARFLEM